MAQYDHIAEAYNQMRGRIKSYVNTPTLVHVVGNIQGKEVLDAGCGAGYFTRVLAEQNPKKIIGADVSEKMIALARRDSSNIEFFVSNVFDLDLGKQFDVVTSTYLLNYSETEQELGAMCSILSSHLKDGGRLAGITLNPDFKPMKEFQYSRKFSNGKDSFEDGDKVLCELKGDMPFNFTCFYWSKEVYESCFRKAGFSKVQWVEPIISPEGLALGPDHWYNFLENHSPIGFICEK
ncbi:class I SAM-dependent methyltransferase [Candidatus Woesearchaeota archaeon]|nr:class I SAM-dependent methyltransferase [Candidatus Woesearchaeota archaeon]